jgi:nucleotide-binding universal stress UspA family protein
MNNILIALDFSKFSPEVARRGYALASRLGARVTLVSVVAKYMDYARLDTGEVLPDLPEERQQQVLETLEKIKKEHPGTDTSIVCFIGDPKTGIVEAAIQENPDFVVIGTHGRTGLSHLLLGSVAEFVVRHSPLPVLVVPYLTNRH